MPLHAQGSPTVAPPGLACRSVADGKPNPSTIVFGQEVQVTVDLTGANPSLPAGQVIAGKLTCNGTDISSSNGISSESTTQPTDASVVFTFSVG